MSHHTKSHLGMDTQDVISVAAQYAKEHIIVSGTCFSTIVNAESRQNVPAQIAGKNQVVMTSAAPVTNSDTRAKTVRISSRNILRTPLRRRN